MSSSTRSARLCMELAGVRASAGSSGPMRSVISPLAGRSSTEAKFFMELGDFAGDAGGTVAENFAGVGDTLGDPVWGFVKNDGAILDAQALEGAAAFAAAIGKKTNEEEFFVRQSAGGKRCKKRGRSGNRDDRNMMAEAEGDQAMAGIGNQRHARVADERDFRALFERDEQLGRARQLVVLVVADERLAHFVVSEELLRMACVFAGDLVDFFKYTQGAKGDVFQIADGRADEIQAAQSLFVIGGHSSAHAFESSTRCGDIL